MVVNVLNGLIRMANEKNGIVREQEVVSYLRQIYLTEELFNMVAMYLEEQNIQILRNNTVDDQYGTNEEVQKQIIFENDNVESEEENELDIEGNILLENNIVEVFKEKDEKEILTDNSLKMYLDDIGRYPLLTVKEVSELSEMKDNGDMSARNMLVESNLRLVVSIAKRCRGLDMNLIDMIQEGNIGLIKGIDKYDYSKGFKLSTYVTWWIRQAIFRGSFEQSRLIRIPVRKEELARKIEMARGYLLTELGREPSDSEIAKRLSVSEDEVRSVRECTATTLSLDAPVDEEKETFLEDVIQASSTMQPEAYVESIMLKDDIKELLSQLNQRERDVIILRYGLDGEKPRTLDEVGKIIGISKEWVRKTELKSLVKLRESKYIESFLN